MELGPPVAIGYATAGDRRAPPHERTTEIYLVAAGSSSIAVTVGGAVYTWGDGRDGQPGDGSTTSTGRTTPGVVPGLTADGVAMGRDFALAIVPSG